MGAGSCRDVWMDTFNPAEAEARDEFMAALKSVSAFGGEGDENAMAVTAFEASPAASCELRKALAKVEGKKVTIYAEECYGWWTIEYEVDGGEATLVEGSQTQIDGNISEPDPSFAIHIS